MDLDTEVWTAIPPPQVEYIDSNGTHHRGAGVMREAAQAEADDNGNLYARWYTGDRNQVGLFRKVGDSNWELIPPPERGQFDESGNWHTIGGHATDLWHLDVTAEGKVYVTWNASNENPNLDYVCYELVKDSSGVESWNPLPPSPRFTYDNEGKVTRLPGRSSLLKTMSVDAEGQMISSIHEPDGPDPLAIFLNEEFVPLPRLPDKRHAPTALLTESDGYLEPFQAQGGGYQNGIEDRYISVYRY